MNKTKRYPVNIVFSYLILSSLWVLFSDLAVESLSNNLHEHALAQTVKGLIFIILTSILLWVMVQKNNRDLEDANDLDSVTGLHSPSVFYRYLNKRLKNSQASDHYVLFLLDIDNFKSVADQIGFENTNSFLKDIARSIELPIEHQPLSSRVHSDGFACLVKLNHTEHIESYIALVHRRFNQCAYRYNINATCCIGAALFPSDGNNAKQLMASATHALTEAKKSKDTIEFHDPKLTELERQEMVQELRKAIDDKAIDIVFQPKFNIESRLVVGVEVLSRWTHERYGVVSPDIFVALAEENYFCRDLTTLVLEKTASQLRANGLLGNALNSVSVNISAVELNSVDDMNHLDEYLRKDPEFARLLCLEITETAILKDIDQCAIAVQKLKKQGVSFSIDDFGVGYTSFGIFSKLDVDEIKVDRSYINGLEDDYRSRAITSGIIDIARGFGISVVAEGVENAQQLSILKTLNCEQAQGYYLGYPMPYKQLKESLTSEIELCSTT
ncbi:putative bifunctional diguanylate cyclase/phosphodiesterase [Vibrio splendidus]|uniref:putative bifunctional diguanylate cyclase/phosphodiesterase n=1 Tax=Vibrio splendidus TaxID=29497 RepID=UPI000D38BD13|nr:GGDEF domain-containing phosphodiesterase [Vibrio splendidus]PTP94758.1 diguanylate cyclase [Vibrio splendidus]